jgi:hypothetical protein
LLTRSNVKRTVADQLKRIEERSEVHTARVIQELGYAGFWDIRRLFDPETGKLKPLLDLDAATAAAVASVKLSRQRTTVSNGGDVKTVVEEALVEVKLANKVEALTQLVRTLGMFDGRARRAGQLSLEELIAGSMKRDREGQRPTDSLGRAFKGGPDDLPRPDL